MIIIIILWWWWKLCTYQDGVVPARLRRLNAAVYRTKKFITQLSQLALNSYTATALFHVRTKLHFCTDKFHFLFICHLVFRTTWATPSLEETYGESICLECCVVWKQNVDSTKKDIRRLQAFEIWTWRHMMKVLWTEHKTNEEILQMAETEREIMDTVRSRQKRWLGHILRHYSLRRIMFEGQIQGKKVHGRPRTCSWIGYWRQRKAISATKN